MARLTVLAGGVVVTVALLAIPATAHEHPSGITDLVTPAVVRVEAVSHVEITLLDHVSRLRHVERSYDFPIGQGTGIVVNPDGAIVTLTSVVKTDDEDVAVRAANKVFAEHHDVKVPQDDKRHSVDDDPILDRHLKDCYPPKRSTATCIIDVTTDITIFPNVSPADTDGFKAELVRAGSGPDAPAVLMPVARAVGSVGMPTAPLAEQVPDQQGAPTSVAGFLGLARPRRADHRRDRPPGQGRRRRREGQPFGDPDKKVDEPAKLGGLADRGLAQRPRHRRQGRPRRRAAHRRRQRSQDDRRTGDHLDPVEGRHRGAQGSDRRRLRGGADPLPHQVLHRGRAGLPARPGALPGQRGGRRPAQGRARQAGRPGGRGHQADGRAGLLRPAAVAVHRRGERAVPRRGRGRVPAVAAPPGRRPGRRPRAGPAARPPQQAYDEGADQTVMVRRSPQFTAVPQQQQQVLTAQESSVKFCTACGMRLGQAHRFCGYCGQPIETS
ncbi:hypothetical protein ACFSTC_37140 [Nonomuraea ferruginea]